MLRPLRRLPLVILVLLPLLGTCQTVPLPTMALTKPSCSRSGVPSTLSNGGSRPTAPPRYAPCRAFFIRTLTHFPITSTPLTAAVPPQGRDAQRRAAVACVALSPEKLNSWQMSVSTACRSSLCREHVVIKTTSEKALVECLLASLFDLWKRHSQICPSVPPRGANKSDVIQFNAITLDSYLTAEYDREWVIFELEKASESAPSTSKPEYKLVTTGKGVERGVFDSAVAEVAGNKNYFRDADAYVIPHFTPLPLQDKERVLWWKACGTLCALYLMYYGRGPSPISPFLLLAAIGGEDAFQKLSLDTIWALDPASAEALQPWFALDPLQDLPTDPMDPVCQLLIQLLDIEVRARVRVRCPCKNRVLTSLDSHVRLPLTEQPSSSTTIGRLFLLRNSFSETRWSSAT